MHLFVEVKGQRAACISWYTALLKPPPLRTQCGAARRHSSEPMPSPRREIESRIRHILPVAGLADVVASEAARGSTRHESRNSQRADLAYALCVADELLAHH